jgi:TetR/AcrR family transcriptional repressor of nem operon
MNAQPDTYQRILESAKELIHASSYADVGVAAICQKANVKKGSFYHFFPSKQDLTLAVIDNYYADFKENIINEAFDPALAPLERIARFMALSIEMQVKIHQQTGHVFGCPIGNLATEVSTQHELLRSRLDRQFDKLLVLFREALQQALDNGEVSGIDVEATARGILALFEGGMLLAKTHNDPQVLRQLLPAAAQLRI